ncbi:hypothetical protein MHY87_13745 [Microvirga sp. ACRRW]|uniref:hypothetical protein n=1 Tax=Microvirga sp. ACRRW TaxID=2918205 RepID=UPI001EF48BEB|nr:hypothetical protein [Microvirga sp. ACRRW]MCG7393969.1 hypothetical protein [Microvirga sp. ACRRW]
MSNEWLFRTLAEQKEFAADKPTPYKRYSVSLSIFRPMLRTIILIILALQTAAWIWFLTILFLYRPDSTDTGWTVVIAAIPITVFVVFALPSLILALKGRLLWLALALALLCPAYLVL